MSSIARKASVDTVSIFLARGASLVLGILRIKYIAIYFGVELFGVYSFALYFVMVFTLVYEMGIHTILIREISKDRSNTEVYTVGAFTLKLLLSGAALLMLVPVIAVAGFTTEVATAIVFSFGISVSQSMILVFSGVYQAHQKMRLVSIFSFATETLITLSIIGALLLGLRLNGVLVTTLVVTAVSLAVQMTASKIQFGYRWRLSRKIPTWKGILKKSYPIAISSVGVAAYLYLSSTLLGLMKDEIQVGYFAVGLKVISVLSVVPASVGQVFFPLFSELYETGAPKLRPVFETVVRLLMTISLPMTAGAILLAPEFISLLFSPEFLPATDSFRLMMCANALNYPNWLMFMFLTAINRQRFQMKITLVLGAAVTLANFLLIPAYSIIAPSLNIAVVEILLFAGTTLYLKRIGYGFSLPRLLWNPVAATAVMCGAVFLLDGQHMLVRVAAGMAVYAAVFLATGGLRRDDREVLARILPAGLKSVLLK